MLDRVEPPVNIHDTALSVTSSGHVTWIRPQMLTLSCASDVDDTDPKCEIIFSSWSLGKQQMQLTAEKNRIDAG